MILSKCTMLSGLKSVVALGMLFCMLTSVTAEVFPPAFPIGEKSKFSSGGDIRIRQVHLDNIPILADPPGVTRDGENHFFRFRTRFWGKLDASENLGLYGRMTNEFRHYEKPENNSMNALDEILMDNLYLDVRNLFNETVDLRLGRQDLIYGTGKVILEGTPKDGSRTIYMDAVKLTHKAMDKTTVDLLGIYNQPENELIFRSEDRDLTGWDPAYNDLTESGGGVYIKNRTWDQAPTEAYYLYKHESDWLNRAGDTMPERDTHTLGGRVVPKFNDRFDGNLEAAYQFGERGDDDMNGYMLDALLNWHPPVMESWAPVLGVGWYYLSGDDPDSSDDEGWNPLWGRWPQYSELYIYAWDADGAGRWSNLSMPHVDFNFAPNDRIAFKNLLGYMFAPEDNGPGPGDERGLLLTMRADLKLKEGLLLEKDELFGHLTLEIVDPGDYYNVDATADFIRWELSYKF